VRYNHVRNNVIHCYYYTMSVYIYLYYLFDKNTMGWCHFKYNYMLSQPWRPKNFYITTTTTTTTTTIS